MPFKLIKGTFHLTGLSSSGNPTSFQPDGDSMQFKPSAAESLDELEVVGRNYRLTMIGSTNLRFEGIDATELHYGGCRQPYPIAEDARDFLTGKLGMNPVAYMGDGVRVQPPANDGQTGFILSKQLDAYGRPVAFVFAGTTQRPDQEWIYVDAGLLRQSLNYQLLRAGCVYPLFYDTLYADLRELMRQAALSACEDGVGLVPFDWSDQWVDVGTVAAITETHTIYPKIFRRLADFHKAYDGFDATAFRQWLDENDENDRVWLLPEFNMSHLDNLLEVNGSKVRMGVSPADIVIVSRGG
jgi:endonuclease YncB( thermonuclease family)